MRKILCSLLCLVFLGLSAGCKTPPKKTPAHKSSAAQADELYIQGVYAYAGGDTQGAMALWEKVLALDSRHQKTLDAMKEARAKMDAVKALKKK